MYLKELTLRGFKSFASATTLRFEPGVTAVVGPNGSGKSNIVDALTWVMGEQGAKNLRGSSMEDVIFAGTSSRAPLGRAQVTLTIDNTDHVLDIDFTEVTISRTIFRNGGSEYALNGTQCRLLDIQELLSDTGLGQQMHVIVGQGRLDAILRADPSGNRAFIEEAAGILKHRKRKERALRKLANTQTNLSRLDDLLGEIHRQLGPLGRQARISRKAEGIQVTLRDAQSRLYADDAARSIARIRDARSALAAVRAELSHTQRELGSVRLRIEQVEALSSESNPEIARTNEVWHTLSHIEERLRSLQSLAEERSRSLRGNIVTDFGEDSSILERRAGELEQQSTAQQQHVFELRLALDQAVERRADEERQLASARQTLTELRRMDQQRGATIANLRELMAREEAAVELSRTRLEDFTAQRESLETQRAEAQSRCEQLQREREGAGEHDGRLLEEAKESLAARRGELDALQDERQALSAKILSLRAKADALADALDSRNASDGLRHDASVHVLGRLTDFITIRDGWEEAVAQALGVFAGAMVVPGEPQMLRALDLAKTDRLGKAIVVHPDATRLSASADVDQRSAAALIEVNPHAEDRAQSERVVRAVKLLVADVAAVVTRQEAMTALGEGPWSQAVTKDGETINAVGAVGGSSLSQSDLSLAARRDKAVVEADALGARIEHDAEGLLRARRAVQEAQRKVEDEERDHTEAQIRAKQLKQSSQEASHRVASLERQMAAVEDSRERARQDGALHQTKLEDVLHALDTTQQTGGEHADMDELVTRERHLESSLTRARDAEMAAKIAWSEASRTAESLSRQAGMLHDQAKQVVERRGRIMALNARRREQADHVQAIASDARKVADIVARSAAKTVERREALQAAASGHDNELKRLRAQRNDIEPQVARLQADEHELDVKRERLAAAYGQLTQKVSDELGLSMEELLAGYGPEQAVPVLDEHGEPVVESDGSHRDDDDREAPGPADYRSVPYVRDEQVKRLERARRDLAALGKVNPLATEEYDALQTRNQYLNDQRNDIASSRDDLMRLINDLDATMADVFASAFEDTAKAFSAMFATLFPGGTGRLRLENPGDMLTTGVIVEASPAGKRVKQLSLLSGGERSLTALALLFAIFTARPSPFYVMDEVEAALDDVNLTRLLDAFKQLREHAQIIVITHQQRTMSIADALYGVTMRADGVTAVVSQKLGQDGASR